MFEYVCKYEGIDETTGRKKVKFGGLTEFGQKALEFLKKSIEISYPENSKQLNQTQEKKDDEQEFDNIMEDGIKN